MKKLTIFTPLFFFLFFFLTITSNCFSQNGWVQINTGTTRSVTDAYFLNNNTGWICGDSGLVAKTTNKGFTWTIFNTNTAQPYFDIQFLDENLGWVAGGSKVFTAMGAMMIVKETFNGGPSWITLLNTTDFENSLTNIHFYDAGNAVAFGSGGNGSASTGVTRSTTNGGSNWNYSTSLPTTAMKIDAIGNIWRISSIGNDVGMDSDYVQISTDKGITWQTKYRNSKIRLLDIDLINDSSPWVLADSGTQKFILKSSDSGTYWTRLNYSMPTFPTSFEFINANTGWACSSQLYYTTNGGVNWTSQLNATPVIGKIIMLDSLQGIGLAANGKVYITGTGGIVNVNTGQNEIPDKFSLSQNYPNPFNPNTIISYQLAINSFVQLKIYDVIGNEVQTLVNEKQNAGSYSVDFNTSLNGSPLPSGIYFYKLVTEKFSETKKMILVK